MSDQKLFAQPNESDWVELAPGNTRRVLIHTPELMQVEFGFEQGAVVGAQGGFLRICQGAGNLQKTEVGGQQRRVHS